jgi:hypothetical protein
MSNQYAVVALEVRTIVFNAATARVMKIYGVLKAAVIPAWFNLGMPAPIGMLPNVITSMRPALNALIMRERADQSPNHGLSSQQLSTAVNVGNLVDLVWAQVHAP